MRKQIVLGTLLMLGATGTALAADGLSYSYVQAAYEKGDLDSAGVKLSGLSVAGSAAFGENLFGFISYADGSKSGVHLKPLTAGVGFHYGLTDSMDLVTGASFENLKVSASGLGSTSESGWGLGVGLRGAVGMAELQAGVKYVDIGDFGNDTVFSVGGRYNFTEMFSAGLDISKWDDLDLTQFSLSLRYSFL